jgi:MATE family multidrug resistance protein
MYAGGVAMTTNVPLAWVMIHGGMGVPAMGVTGAAIASVIASWAGFAVIAIAFARGWGLPDGARPTREPMRLQRHELWRVVRFGLPNGVNWFLEFAAFQLFLNGVMPGLGSVTLGSLMVVMAINNVSFMPAFGLASSGAVLAGQAIGQGEKNLVWPHVRLTLATTMTWMGTIACVYLAAPRALLSSFAPPDHHAEWIAVGSRMLLISAGWQLFDAAAMTFTEVLRAAGDTAWSAIARIVVAWGVFTPLAFVAVRVFGGGADVAMVCLVIYVALLACALAFRFRSGAWRSIELTEPTLV